MVEVVSMRFSLTHILYALISNGRIVFQSRSAENNTVFVMATPDYPAASRSSVPCRGCPNKTCAPTRRSSLRSRRREAYVQFSKFTMEVEVFSTERRDGLWSKKLLRLATASAV